MKFGFDWPGSFGEEDVKNNGHVHVYSPGTGVNSPSYVEIFSKT